MDHIYIQVKHREQKIYYYQFLLITAKPIHEAQFPRIANVPPQFKTLLTTTASRLSPITLQYLGMVTGVTTLSVASI